MIEELQPYHLESKAISYNVEPADEETIKNFGKISSRISNFQDRLRSEQRDLLDDFSFSDCFIQPHESIPHQDFLETYNLNYSKMVMVYEEYLQNDTITLEEAFEKYSNQNEKGDNEISFDNVERVSGDKIKGTSSELNLYFDISQVAMKERGVSFDDLDTYGVYLIEDDVADNINDFIGVNKYSKWNFSGSTKKLIKQKKSDKLYNELESIFYNHDTEGFFRELSNSYLTSYEAHRLYYIASGHTDSILFNYNCLNTELVDLIIESFNLDYINIPQVGKIILHDGSFPVKNKYQEILEEKNVTTISQKEQFQLLNNLGVSESSLAKMYQHGESYYLKEIENVCEMYYHNKLTKKEFESYLWSPYYSNLTEESVYEVVQDGRKRKEKDPGIISSKDKVRYDNKVYFYPILDPYR